MSYRRAAQAFAMLVPVVAALTLIVGACSDSGRSARSPVVPYGDADRGQDALASYGCGSCHTIPGVKGADALVGPPLNKFGSRTFVAGQLANTPDNLKTWIMNPPGVEPGTAMPDLDVTEQDAEDMVAYLESL